MSTEKTKSAGADLVTKVVTDKVRFSYVHVFEPTSMEESTDKKYSVSIIISKKNKTLIEKIKKAVAAAAELGKTKKFGGKIPTVNFKNPLRDGDIDRSEDTAFEDSYFITASSKTKPGLVDKDLNPVMDQGEIYSGCYGRVSVNFYPFNANGNKGIACGLNNLQKLEDGDPLSGRATAEVDFSEDDDLL